MSTVKFLALRRFNYIDVTGDKRVIHLGLRDTAEQANELYTKAAKKMFGEFYRVG